MAMDIFVHATGADAHAACVAEGLDVEVDGEWLRGDDAPDVGESLSKKIAAPVVSFSIQTAVDQIWIQCWVTGKCVRELRYTSDGGWTKRGKAMPFEHSALKGWLKQKKLLASPDGYDVLQCFLGRERSSPGEPVIEPGGTQNTFSADSAPGRGAGARQPPRHLALNPAYWDLAHWQNPADRGRDRQRGRARTDDRCPSATPWGHPSVRRAAERGVTASGEHQQRGVQIGAVIGADQRGSRHRRRARSFPVVVDQQSVCDGAPTARSAMTAGVGVGSLAREDTSCRHETSALMRLGDTQRRAFATFAM